MKTKKRILWNHNPCREGEHQFEIISQSRKISIWKGVPLWKCKNVNCSKIVESM